MTGLDANPQIPLPLGKLPPDLLAGLLSRAPQDDDRIVLGPGVGLDCAVVQGSDRLLVFKAEPITFATDQIGWYGIQVAANDIATTGAEPRWYLATLLLPEGKTSPQLVEQIGEQIFSACRRLGISLIGGHTEITYGLDRPLLVGTLIGEVERQRLVTPRGARPGDRLLLTKGVPIEATALLAREFPDRIGGALSPAEREEAMQYLYTPGISVVADARIATSAGQVTAMHDPTEGGLASALWELAEASGKTLEMDLKAVFVPPLARKICEVFDIDPLGSIASGALLMSVNPADAASICRALEAEGIACSEIGLVQAGGAAVRLPDGSLLHRPQRDEITRVYES